MPQPAQWFVKAIGLLDPLLRVRWGSAPCHWIIDRKAVVPAWEIHNLRRKDEKAWKDCQSVPVDSEPNELHKRRMRWQSVHEELVSAEDQRRVIFTTPHLTQKTYDWICESDIKRYGGYARFADALEAQEDAIEADHARIMENKRLAMNAEVYDMLGFIRRKRAVALDNNEQDLKYLLHGDRTKAGDKPLVALTDL